jgi:hypothetical protein
MILTKLPWKIITEIPSFMEFPEKSHLCMTAICRITGTPLMKAISPKGVLIREVLLYMQFTSKLIKSLSTAVTYMRLSSILHHNTVVCGFWISLQIQASSIHVENGFYLERYGRMNEQSANETDQGGHSFCFFQSRLKRKQFQLHKT